MLAFGPLVKEAPLFTLGTAGHIDHGKTTLCLHLTGVDTDRLGEEKSRGISIELGFAELETPRGQQVGLIDVPGHERFIRNMVAGVCGIDGVLFVVAADEGVMPQTREHFDIIRLLGVEDGIVVLTKCDMAEEELIDLVEEDLKEFLEDTPLAGAPIVRTRPDDPASYDKLRHAVDDLLGRLKPRLQSGHFRLPIDRAFTLKGHGTVVTGTVASGTIHKGDIVNILPEGIPSRIRSIQSFGSATDTVVGGQRAALNLPDVPVSAIGRGSCACPEGVFTPAYMVDGRFKMLRNLPKGFSIVKHASRVRFYVGTSEVIGRIHLLDCNQVEEGGEALVQFRLEQPLVAARGDRFLVRTFSPLFTIGGGVVLDASAQKHKNRAKAAEELERKASSDPGQVVLAALEENPAVMLDLITLSKELALPQDQVTPHLPPETENAGILHFKGAKGDLYCSERHLLAERLRLVNVVEQYHSKESTSPGMARASLQQTYSATVKNDVFNLLLEQLLAAGDLVKTGKLIARAGFEPKLDQELLDGLRALRKTLSQKSEPLWTPKLLGDKCNLKQKALQKLIGLLLNSGELARLPGGNFARSEFVEEMRQKVVSFIESQGGQAETNDIKNHLGLSRKHLIPFLEHLDESGVTLRIGNARKLRAR